LRLTGGIGDILIKAQWDDKRQWYEKYIYEFTYYLLVIVIMLNIFLAIIVSTFAQLRDQKKAIMEDMKGVCFVCGLSREALDRDGNGFETHIKKDHYLWHYVHFLVHLREKDPTEYTGVESCVAELLVKGDIAWMPLDKALTMDLGVQEQSEPEAVKARLAQLEALLEQANAKLELRQSSEQALRLD